MKKVFTNGCFDILHVGHVKYLQLSRNLGDWLIVGLNSDDSVRRLKGSHRPINTELDRKLILEALSCVDEVIIFNEDTPLNLILQVEPDIVTKGGDWAPKDIVGIDIVSKVVVIPSEEGYSTTNLIRGIRNDQT